MRTARMTLLPPRIDPKGQHFGLHVRYPTNQKSFFVRHVELSVSEEGKATLRLRGVRGEDDVTLGFEAALAPMKASQPKGGKV